MDSYVRYSVKSEKSNQCESYVPYPESNYLGSKPLRRNPSAGSQQWPQYNQNKQNSGGKSESSVGNHANLRTKKYRNVRSLDRGTENGASPKQRNTEEELRGYLARSYKRDGWNQRSRIYHTIEKLNTYGGERGRKPLTRLINSC